MKDNVQPSNHDGWRFPNRHPKARQGFPNPVFRAFAPFAFSRLVPSLAITLICASMLYAQQPGDWPSFRGGPEMTGKSASTLPAKPRLLWTYEAGGAVESTAAIVGDTVYVGTKKKQVIALNLNTGKPKWKFAASDSVSASPCVSRGTVFVGDENGVFYAINAATGKQIWKFKANDKIISSATATSGVVLFGSYDHNLYCLAMGSGKLKWKLTADAQVHCSPCVAGGQAIIAGCDGKVRFIDIATGKQKAAATLEGNLAAAPAYRAGTVYLGTLNGEHLAVRAKDGKVLWMTKDKNSDGGIYSTAAVTPNAAIFSSRGRVVFSVNPATGKSKWVFRAKGETDSSPVISGNRIYVGCDAGELYGLNLSTGKREWLFKTGSEIKASPAIARGKMIIGSGDGAVYCFGG